MRKLMLLVVVVMFLLSISVLAQASGTGNQLSVGDVKTFKFCFTNNVVFVNIDIHKATFTLNDKVGNAHTYQYMGADAPADENAQIKLKELKDLERRSGDTITLDYLYQAYAGGVKGAKLTVGLQQDYAGGIKEGKDYWLVLDGSPDSNEMDARLMIYANDMATLPASGEEPVCSNYEIKLNQMGYDDESLGNVADQHFVKLEVNGEITNKINFGGSYSLADGSVLSITDILYQAYAGGEQRVWFVINGEQGTEVVQVVSENLETSPVSKSVDLSNYPELFVKNGKLNVFFVVGGKSPAMDNLAMTDIAVGFDEAGYEVVNVAKLDSEVSNPLNTNLIVIGKVTDNTVAHLLMNGVSDYLSSGEGMIKLFEDDSGHAQLLVTGYSAEDTRRAAKVLQNYDQYNLHGWEMIVTGTRENPIVTAKTPFNPDESQPVSQPEEETPEESQPEPTPQVEVPQKAECVSGCQANGNCLPYGTRLVKDGEQVYCSIDGTLQEQQELNVACQNNYECSSNQCSNGLCVDLQQLSVRLEETNSLLARILAWIEKIFS